MRFFRSDRSDHGLLRCFYCDTKSPHAYYVRRPRRILLVSGDGTTTLFSLCVTKKTFHAFKKPVADLHDRPFDPPYVTRSPDD